ncbi:MAG TPA: 50S ribosomal protein L2 [Patescibacteria group bacterium]|nr:50S ribosomal protein L2 [Patescibacteria group bacterium]
MGKRIISQARGHGSFSYRVRRKAFKFRIKYPKELEGEGTVVRLLNSPAHTAPLAKIVYNKGAFYMPAFKGMIEGQKIQLNGNEVKDGNILRLKDIPVKTFIYNIESRPGDGGVFIRTGGNSATVSRIQPEGVFVMLPSKKEKKFNENCRATVGVIAGAGRLEKPIVKAGKSFYIKKSRNKLWPRTSALKMNVIDHPFGSGRGKHPKSKIAKRNAPAGARVGLLRPRRTGRKKK